MNRTANPFRKGILGLPLAALITLPAFATEVRIFRAAGPATFLGGEIEGLSVDLMGRLELADRVERLAGFEEPVLLAAAAHPTGWVIGTGNAGRVLLVDRRGQVSELFAAPEPGVSALWCDADGTVFAGTSPNGKVYRIADGRASELFAPGELYIWSLARAADGSLLVATGASGKVFKVDSGGRGTLFYDSREPHVRVLLPLPDGGLLVGTAGEGLVVHLDAEGRGRTLHNPAATEILALTRAADGTVYAAAGGDGGPGGPAPVAATRQDIAAAAPAGVSSPSPTPAASPGAALPPAPPANLAAPAQRWSGSGLDAAAAGRRSEVFAVAPGGRIETIWSFSNETVGALLWHRGQLWVGTGDTGRLFRYEDGHMVLETEVVEHQVWRVLPDGGRVAFATANAPALFRQVAGIERSGRFTSPPFDTGGPASFGSIRWRGEEPPGTRMELSVRSGMSSEPDDTWSEWTLPAAGPRVGLDELPEGRFLQWRVLFSAQERDLSAAERGASPRLDGIEISYRRRNSRPRIAELSVMDPGQILAPTSFNPTDQVYEPSHPNRDGIFTTLEASSAGVGAPSLLKTLWKRGYRCLRWSVEDPDDDRLVYELSFRGTEWGTERGGTERGGTEWEEQWLPVVSETREDYYNFDATAVPDGIYRFRIVASDRLANPAAEALSAERISEPVVIDHTPPGLEAWTRGDGFVEVQIADALNSLREVVFSIDAGVWRSAVEVDGLLDAPRETLRLDLPPQARLLLVRATDAAFNAITLDLSQAVHPRLATAAPEVARKTFPLKTRSRRSRP